LSARVLLGLVLALFAPGVFFNPGPRDLSQPPRCQLLLSQTSRGGATFVEPSRQGLVCNPQSNGRESAQVIRVVDGDTIVIAGNRRVRYIGIQAPEMGARPQFYGPEATQANRRLLEGKIVTLEKDVSETDRFGRLLRYVYVDGIQVNAELVREGYARAAAYPPDTRYQECLELLAQEARQSARGIWARR